MLGKPLIVNGFPRNVVSRRVCDKCALKKASEKVLELLCGQFIAHRAAILGKWVSLCMTRAKHMQKKASWNVSSHYAQL